MIRHLFKLRFRLLLLVVLAALPPLVLIGYLSLQQRQAAELAAQEDALKLAQQVASLQERMIENTRSLLSLLARVPQVRHYQSADCSGFLSSLLSQNSVYANFGVINPDGSVTCSALPLSGPVNASDRSYFRRAQETRSFAIGQYQIGRITGRPSINMALPLPARDGEPPAAVFAAMDLAVLSRLFADARLPSGSTVTLVDANNTVLARYPDPTGRVGEKSPIAPVLRQRLNGDEVGTFRIEVEGGERLFAVTSLLNASGDLLLFHSMPANLAFAAANQSLWQGLVALGAMALGLLITAWLSSSVFVLRGINALLAATRRLGAGELSTRSGVPYSHGEVGELAQAFDDMATALQARNIELASHQTRIDRLNRVYAVLSAISSTIIRVKDLDTLYTAACRIAVEQGRFSLAWIAEVQPVELVVQRVWRAGDEGDTLGVIPTVGEAITDRRSAVLAVIREGRLMVYNDVGKYPRAEPWQNDALELGLRSCVFIPLQVEGEVAACLSLYAEELNYFDAEEIELLKELASDISLGLDYLSKSKRLNYLAYYDTLTRLPNLSLFRDRLRQAIIGTRSHQGQIAVLIIAIDGLRAINSAHGHHVGDLLLKETAERLRQGMREGDTVARLHNDEFGVLLTDVAHMDDVAFATRKILQLFATPARLAGIEVFMTVRIGITVFPNDGYDADSLIKNAGAALGSLRGSNESYRFFTAELQAQANHRLEIERELRHALERNELYLNYQPVVSIASGRIKAVEALLRWRSATLGEVSPAEFIPIAEESGLINGIGEWVLREACAQAERWRAQGLAAVRIAVNLSVVQLKHAGFAERVQAILQEHGFRGAGTPIAIELTESKLMENAEQAIGLLEELRAQGLTIAIDDFGTGYSSLSYLKRLPVDTLKIDIAFVRDITIDPNDAAIVRAIIGLAHHLGCRVVAEGVETEAQLALLKEFGCDAVQGYLFSRPVAPEQIVRLHGEGWPALIQKQVAE